MKGKFYEELSNRIISKEDFITDYEALYNNPNESEVSDELYLLKRVLESAAIFACSPDDEHRNLALDILSRIIESGIKYEGVQAAIELILIRLGLFPTISLSIDQYGYKDFLNIWNKEKIQALPPVIASEIAIKETKNKYSLMQHEEYLTDFQAEVLNRLSKKESLSISAPTSAGKSFILKRYILQQFIKKDKFTAVYIVPTRALISQIHSEFKEDLKKYRIVDVDIFTSSYELVGDIAHPYKKSIMILTPERLQTIEGKTDNFEVNLLIVDEAQKIENTDRGIILEESVSQLIEWNPNAQVVFLAPFAENPEKIGGVFNSERVKTIKTDFSPVNQNLFLIDEKRNAIELSLFSPELNERIHLQSIPISRKISENSYERKVWVAMNIIEPGPTMIYCNGPDSARKTANSLSSMRGKWEINDDVEELIGFLRENIHKDYYLIDYLKKGVAYHYGNVPSIVRASVETLFSNKSIDFICCTSTLLEGVNFPTKNVILHKPRTGEGALDFLSYSNIAGRAGRLMKDFSGNIYAIDVDKWSGYKPDQKKEKHEIRSSMEEVIKSKKDKIIEHLRQTSMSGGEKDVEAAVTRFIIKEIRKGNKEFVGQLLERNNELNESDLNQITRMVEEIVEQLNIPSELILTNLSMDPRLQDALYQHLLQMKNPPYPSHPSSKDFSRQLKLILQLIKKSFKRTWSDKQVNFFTDLATSWANESTLGEIIIKRLNYKATKGSLSKEKINKTIEELIKTINSTIRFEIRRDLGVYVNILSYINEQNGLNIQMDEKLGYYLELGVSRPTTLALVNNGIPRTLAIMLRRKVLKEDDMKDINIIKKRIESQRETLEKELPSFMIEKLFE